MCESLEPALIILYFACNESDISVKFKVVSSNSSPRRLTSFSLIFSPTWSVPDYVERISLSHLTSISINLKLELRILPNYGDRNIWSDFAIPSGKYWNSNSLIFQHDNNPKHTVSAVKPYLDRKHTVEYYQSCAGIPRDLKITEAV